MRFVGSSWGAVQAKNPKQRKVSNKRTGHVERAQDIVLDYFLATTYRQIGPRHPKALGRLLRRHVAQVILQDLAGRDGLKIILSS
jgi:hypothetical protein